MNDLNLVKKISRTKKPIIISTGMASLAEIEETVNTAKKMAQEILLFYIASAIIHQN